MTLRVAVITISDRSYQREREDISGPVICNRIHQLGWHTCYTTIIPDELETIKNTLISCIEKENPDIILTTGGTGFAPRDVTPEATLAVIEKEAPGLAEVMRSQSLKITPYAMLSRAVAGIRGQTLIINLPGSPKAAVENLEAVQTVLPHAVELLRDDPKAQNHSFTLHP